MSDPDVPTGDMRRLLTLIETQGSNLDPNTAERLLNGQLPVEDAPPDAQGVARVIAAVAAAPSERELAVESETVATLTAIIREQSVAAPKSRRTPMSKQRITQLAAAGTVGVMTLFGGLAAANALPGAAQGVASDMLAKVGVSVPSPNDHAGSNPDSRGQSTSHPTDSSVSSSASPSASDKGSTISNLARTTTATGVDKGAAISSAASNGASQAGADHGSAPAATPDASAPFPTPPVSAPPFVTPPVSAPPVSVPPVATPPVEHPPVPTPPVPTDPGDSTTGLTHRP
jgi:hypothetical protein